MTARTLVLAALLTAAASAQTTAIQLVADTDVGAFATAGQTTDLKTTAKGTRLTRPLAQRAQVRGVNSFLSAGMIARAREVRFTTGGNIADQVTSGSAGTTRSTTRTGIRQGPVSFLMTLSSRVRGVAVVTALGTVSGTGKAGVAVDIGADNTIEFQAAADDTARRRSFPLTAGAKIRVTIDGSATAGRGTDRYSMTLVVAIRPQVGTDCFITRYGVGCAQVGLGGVDRPGTSAHNFTFQVRNAFASKPVAFLFGSRRANTPIPGTRCRLLVQPVATVSVTANAQRMARLQIATSARLNGTIYMQALPFDAAANRVTSSNGLRIDCFDR